MTNRIILEGIWGSNLEQLVDRLLKEQKITSIEYSIPPCPFNGLRGWTYGLTESMATWRKEKTETAFYMRSVWSAYAYARPFASEDELDQEELALFQDMTSSLSELLKLPDVIVYCHAFSKEAKSNLSKEGSICAEISEEKLTELSNSLVQWLDEMKNLGVKLIEIPPPFSDFETWYSHVLKELKDYIL